MPCSPHCRVQGNPQLNIISTVRRWHGGQDVMGPSCVDSHANRRIRSAISEAPTGHLSELISGSEIRMSLRFLMEGKLPARGLFDLATAGSWLSVVFSAIALLGCARSDIGWTRLRHRIIRNRNARRRRSFRAFRLQSKSESTLPHDAYPCVAPSSPHANRGHPYGARERWPADLECGSCQAAQPLP